MLSCKDTISIVGSGISGLMCAITLANSASCSNKKIFVYERATRVGGRAHTLKVRDCYIELGAGRFSQQLHENVFEQVTLLGLEYESFPFTQRKHPQPLHGQLKEILTELKPFCNEHKSGSFTDFLKTYVGLQKTQEIIDALGYDSLALSNISPLLAFDIIEKHPEIQDFTRNTGYTWYNLNKGFSSLTQALYEHALSLGVKFNFEHELVEINSNHGQGSLVFQANNDKPVVVSQGEMVLTSPPTTMRKFNCGFPEDWSDYTYGSVPLFKGFLFYDTAWWQDLALTDHVVITNNPLRKLYFKDNRYLFFYTDSDSADYWHKVTSQPDVDYLTVVKSLIAESLGCDTQQIPDPIEHTYKYWHHGVEFSLECCPDHPQSLQHTHSQIISTSDAYTSHCGWMEGGIMAGKSAAAEVLKRLE
jgi:monoamine oxidase